MKLTKKQERWIKELEELWNFFEARLKVIVSKPTIYGLNFF